MHLHFRNANTAFKSLVTMIHEERVPLRRCPSRAGDVIMIDEPVIVTYERPLERVLFNAQRDANCFFHLFESIWMIAGRNDVAPLLKYNSKIADVASDDGKTFNGAYGYRWRHALGFAHSPWGEEDQLAIIVDQLKRKPESRRVVLQMWNVQDDLLKIDCTKDVCCNTNAYFALRQATREQIEQSAHNGYVLDMTVCNRSNDMIWGMLGANVVHFAFLQEYLAACIGVGVGVYHQMTNNLHVYTERWQPDKWLQDYEEGGPKSDKWYGENDWGTVPLVQDQATFDRECAEFVDNTDWTRNWQEPFLQHVASPMCWAYESHKRREYYFALRAMDAVQADDWRIAGTQWIQRRRVAWQQSRGLKSLENV